MRQTPSLSVRSQLNLSRRWQARHGRRNRGFMDLQSI
jgi:hypothetical protein